MLTGSKNTKIPWRKIVTVAKLLERDPKTVHQRIKKLKTGKSAREYKLFTFQEDCSIIDNAIVNLLKCNSLQDTCLSDSNQVATSLNRNERSVSFRWNIQLRAWLLQYYKKSLNLEIRPMLANVIADKFESYDTIDWNLLTRLPEFAGFTEDILCWIFSSKIVSNVSRRLKMKRSQLTLKQIANDAEDYYKNKKILKRVEKRQQQVINYFEKSVQKLKIKDFV